MKGGGSAKAAGEQELDEDGRRWIQPGDLPDWLSDQYYFQAKLTPDQIAEFRNRMTFDSVHHPEAWAQLIQEFEDYVRDDDRRHGRRAQS